MDERKRPRKTMAEANITAAALKTQVGKSQREGNERKDRKNIRNGGTQLEPTGVVVHSWSPQVWWHTAGAHGCGGTQLEPQFPESWSRRNIRLAS